jgi:hypothetical protein
VKHSLEFRTDPPPDVVAAVSGVASLEGLDALVGDLLVDPRYLPRMSILFDYRQLDWTELRPEDIVRRVHVPLKEADLVGPARIAVVSADDRMSKARTLRADEPEWKTFRTVDDAREWLDVVQVSG